MFEFMLKKLASKVYPYDEETRSCLLKHLRDVETEISKEAQLLLFLLPNYQELIEAYGYASCHVLHDKVYDRILADEKSVEILKYLVKHGHSLAAPFVVRLIKAGGMYDEVLEIYLEDRNISYPEQMALLDCSSVSNDRMQRLLRIVISDAFLCDEAENKMIHHFINHEFDSEIQEYHRQFGLNEVALEIAIAYRIIKAEN